MKTINLKIYGMDCVACLSSVKKILLNSKGIRSAEVFYSTSEAKIEVDESLLNLDELNNSLNKFSFYIPISTFKLDTSEVEKTTNILINSLGVKEVVKEDLGITLKMYSIGGLDILREYLKDCEYEIIEYDDGLEELEANNQLSMLRRLLISLLITTPLLWSPAPIVQFILASLLLLIPGRYFYCGFKRSIKSKQLNMDFLIALSTTIIYLYSTYLALTIHEDIQLYYLCDGVLLTLVLFGKYLEIIAKGETSKSIKSLFHLIPSKAIKLENGMEKEVSVDSLKVDDLIKVKSGHRFPSDAFALEQCEVDESLITGESRLVLKKEGDFLIGGSLNRKNDVLINIARIRQDTVLNKMIDIVKETQNSVLPIQAIADKISNIFIIAVLIIAIIVFSGYYFIYGNITKAMLTMCGVLVVACPCALGLATPTSIMVGTNRGMELGILYRSGIQLEKAAKANIIFFDKTGTLTSGDVLNDQIKDGAYKMIADLKKMNLRVVMLSGDKKEVVENIANKLNIDEYYYELSPSDKNDYIKKLKSNGDISIMVGDGINDGPALASSDVSITFQKASDVAKDVSGIVITNNELNSIVTVIKLAKQTMKNIYGNLLWALCYNIICIPLACFGIMNPSIASAAMSFSSIAVLLHSLSLRNACE